MPENSVELADRLKREGRFDAFQRRKADLVASGARAKEAWIAAAAEFPPLSADTQAQTRAPEPAATWTGPVVPTADIGDAARWVLDRMGREVPPESAPSSGAWSLLQWANASPDKFHSIFGARLVKRDDWTASEAEIKRLCDEDEAKFRALEDAVIAAERKKRGICAVCNGTGQRQPAAIAQGER